MPFTKKAKGKVFLVKDTRIGTNNPPV